MLIFFIYELINLFGKGVLVCGRMCVYKYTFIPIQMLFYVLVQYLEAIKFLKGVTLRKLIMSVLIEINQNKLNRNLIILICYETSHFDKHVYSDGGVIRLSWFIGRKG